MEENTKRGRQGSNLQPTVLETVALPIALHPQAARAQMNHPGAGLTNCRTLRREDVTPAIYRRTPVT